MKKKIPNLRLSVSSVEAFEGCQAKWYYRYVKKLPSPSTYHTATGSFIHKILEIFLRRYKKNGGDLRNAASVAYGLAQRDPELGPSLTDEIRAEGKAWLKAIVKQYEKNSELIPEVLEVEKSFSFKIEEENITVRGFIDRIDKVTHPETGEEHVLIVDYKTSGNPKYLKSFQLATYAYAVDQLYPNNKIEAAYELIRFDFDRMHHDISDFKTSVVPRFKKAASEIRKLKETSPDKAWKPTITKLCGYCPYRMTCEKDRETSSWEV